MEILIWIGAVSPIVVLFLLISLFQMKTERAALIGLAAAIVLSVLVGKSDFKIIGIDLSKGIFSALNILIVIWPAIFLYQILNMSKAFGGICKLLQQKTEDQLMLILLIGWLFSSFLQSITGFGVPVAVCAPLLIALGIAPLWSVIVTLLGHAWANTYGTFALAWEALISQSETQQLLSVKLVAGGLLWLIDIAGVLLICWLYGKWKAVRHMLPFVIIISTIHGGGQLLVSLFNPVIAAFLPTAAALLIAWLILSIGFYQSSWHTDNRLAGIKREKEKLTSGISEKSALFPFIVLTLISILILLVRPVNQILNKIVFQLSFPATETGLGFSVEATDAYGTIHIFTHAGFVLLLTCVITYFAYRKWGILKSGKFLKIWRETIKKVMPASLGILFLIMMAQVLKGSGMMQIVAEGVTMLTGGFYGAFSPLLGLLGAFVTSSNTSSNILLGSFQKISADLLKLPEAAVLAGQTAGGAIGTVVGPSTILLGTTTANSRGKEGKVLKFMLPIVLAEALITGCITYLIIVYQ